MRANEMLQFVGQALKIDDVGAGHGKVMRTDKKVARRRPRRRLVRRGIHVTTSADLIGAQRTGARPEDRGSMTEDRGPKTEERRQSTEDRGQRAEEAGMPRRGHMDDRGHTMRR